MAVERLQEKLTKENPWLNILHLLESHDMYAYEIKEKINARFGFEPAMITV